MEIALDTAEGLGVFAEIETLAHGEADLTAAQQAVLALAGTLGLTEVEPRSYLRMSLEARGTARSEIIPECFEGVPRAASSNASGPSFSCWPHPASPWPRWCRSRGGPWTWAGASTSS